MGRIRSLDSLRGLAALIVVLYHFSLVVPEAHARLQAIYPLRLFLAGETAVLVFFVLSGLVLFLSLERHDRDSWIVFAARRLVRLFPPIVAAVLISAALYLLVEPGPLPWRGPFTRYLWTDHPDLGLIAGHLLLLDGDRYHTLDGPMWSLVIEVRLSLLFPFLAAAIRRWPVSTVACCMILSWTARLILWRGHEVIKIDPLLTLQYLDLFAIGAFMARRAGPVSRAIRRVPAPLFAVATLMILCLHGRFIQYFMYGGALLVVAASFTYPLLARVYALRPFVWLGERSFSLYLVHVPVLLAAVHALAGSLPIGLILAGTFPACLVAAELFWLAVERPSIQLGRHVGRRLSRRLDVKAG